ncbi:hypothetical protein U0070_010108 [Myodes glareolus]|uniref:RRM domain-containing protein n=1 Tax=Myodes glareolus TaxID=447135 RepID=A0AAW0I320_MYOGA
MSVLDFVSALATAIPILVSVLCEKSYQQRRWLAMLPTRQILDPNLNILVVKKSDVEAIFSKYGKIVGCSVHMGFAFIQYVNERNAQAAVAGEDGRMIAGQILDINLLQSQKGTKEKQHVFLLLLLLLLLLELWYLLNANVFLETTLEGAKVDSIPRVDNGALLPNLEKIEKEQSKQAVEMKNEKSEEEQSSSSVRRDETNVKMEPEAGTGERTGWMTTAMTSEGDDQLELTKDDGTEAEEGEGDRDSTNGESDSYAEFRNLILKPGGVSLADRNLRKDKTGKDGGSHIDTIRYLPITGAGRAGVTLTSGRLFTCPRELGRSVLGWERGEGSNLMISTCLESGNIEADAPPPDSAAAGLLTKPFSPFSACPQASEASNRRRREQAGPGRRAQGWEGPR